MTSQTQTTTRHKMAALIDVNFWMESVHFASSAWLTRRLIPLRHLSEPQHREDMEEEEQEQEEQEKKNKNKKIKWTRKVEMRK